MKHPAEACLLILSALVAGCTAVTSPPVVVPTLPPSARTVQATIRGTTNPSAQLLIDTGDRFECALAPLPDGLKRAVCPLSTGTPTPFGAHLILTAPERIAQTINFVLTGEPNQPLDDVTLTPSFVTLPRLVVNGQFFRLATGERWTAIEASDFNLYARFLAGDDIEPVLRQRADAGFNLLRVFTAFSVDRIGRLAPRDRIDSYTLLPAFLQQCAKHNLYVELVAFTGPYGGIFDTADQMVAHWNNLVAIATQPANTNLLLELINEFDNPPNAGVPIDRLQRPPPPILASHGSATQDATPLQPWWDYVTYHSAQPRKVVHNGWSDIADPFHVPVVVNETARAPDTDKSLAHWQDIGRGCAAMEAGCAFHSVHGKDSTLWVGTELTLAIAFAQAARSVNLEFQDGYYVHDESREPGPAPCPCERYYEKRLPDGRSVPIPIRP